MHDSSLPAIPIVWALFSAIGLGIAPKPWRPGLGAIATAILLAVDLGLAARVADGTVLVHRVGAWPAPFGIVLVADRLAATLLLLASGTALAVLTCGHRRDAGLTGSFPSLFQFLLLGLNGAFLTGDLFNLFVFFEILLISSYALLTLGARPRQLRAGIQFVVWNLATSTLFLFGVGVLYGATGTLNLADLAQRAAQGNAGLVQLSMMVLLVVFASKAALLPFAFWMPDSYPAASPLVAAMFGGIATKVGVYALLRVFTTAFTTVRAPAVEVLMGLGAASMLLGVLGAVAQTDLRRLLSFHIVSQIGYLVFGIALFDIAGLAATLFYLIHYTLVKCSLFLIGAVIERMRDTGDLKRLGGLRQSSPVLAALFLVAGLSLAGIPPSSGFVSKLLLLDAGLASGHFFAVAIALTAGALTLFSMIKIWTMAFWGEVHESDRPSQHPAPSARELVAVGSLVAFSLLLPLGGEAILGFTRATAAQILDSDSYVRAVLGENRGHMP